MISFIFIQSMFPLRRRKEKFSLVVVFQALRGQELTIETRYNAKIIGKVYNVDDYMK